MVLYFKHGSRAQAKGFLQFLGYADFAVIQNNGIHGNKIGDYAGKSIRETVGATALVKRPRFWLFKVLSKSGVAPQSMMSRRRDHLRRISTI